MSARWEQWMQAAGEIHQIMTEGAVSSHIWRVPLPPRELRADQITMHRLYASGHEKSPGNWVLWCERGPLELYRAIRYNPRSVWRVCPFRLVSEMWPQGRAELERWLADSGLEDVRTQTRREMISVVRATLLRDPIPADSAATLRE